MPQRPLGVDLFARGCSMPFQAADRECGGDSTNKSLKTEVRLFHNLQRLETVQGREAGLLERLSSQQRKFPSSRDTG